MIPISKPLLGKEEEQGIKEVLNSGFLSQGEKVKEFEEEFSEYIGTKFAVATNNGTSALHVALASLGIKSGDEVITPAFSFIASANCILMLGATPVFCDIDPKTYNLDPAKLEERISDRTKAVIAVHLYGQPCDMRPILEVAKDHDLFVVEDASQAHGAEYQGKKVGSLGDVGCFSFYSTKNMTTGEGGMITSNDERVAKRARMIRNHGQTKSYTHIMLGYNYRMTDLAAAIGICQLKKLDKFNKRRIKNGEFLTKEIKKIRGLVTPYIQPNVRHVFHQYTIRITEDFGITRDDLKLRLNKKGIDARIYYPIPIHKQPLYQKLGYRCRLPVSEKVANEVLSLPVHPALTKEDLKRIVEAIK
jgi:perosamine synthetase